MKTAPSVSVFILPILFSSMSLAAPAPDPLGQQLGTVRFEVSGNGAAQEQVVRGVKLLHHMMYVEADRAFSAAVSADPACPLAYWGRAMAIIHPLWTDTPSAAELKQGAEFIRAGLAIDPPSTRERDYLTTLGRYFGEASTHDHPTGLKAVDHAWDELARKYPDDLDAAAFSALFHLAPARFLPKDKSHRIQLQSAAIIQNVLAKIPDHPGAQHYKIHAFDFPLLADRALEICDSYGEIAPDVPHALHMPTHIYTRRGLWEKSIEYNRRSAEAAKKLNASAGLTYLHYPHALDYLAYAYLQRGQYREADAIRQEILAMTGPYHAPSQGGIAFALAAIPARYALERHDWAAAAQVKLHHPASFPWGDSFLHCDSIVHFARALGAVRSGNPNLARREIDRLEELKQRLAATHPGSYWASQAETQVLAARAWLLLKDDNPDQALSLMRRAAELETLTDKEAVTPGEVLPAGELLGDMLIELNRPGEALAAFEAVLANSPNRLNSLYSAGRAAEAAGDLTKATRHYKDLLTLVAHADAGVPGVQHAQAFLTGAETQRRL